jgi:hypothetical protein
MLFALIVMAGVVLLVAVVNNRREPSWWTAASHNGRAVGPQMDQRGHSAVTRVVTVGLTAVGGCDGGGGGGD